MRVTTETTPPYEIVGGHRFEVFIPTRSPRLPSASPLVTIGRDGKIFLNRPAVKAIGDPPRVRLYFNAATRMGRLCPTTEGGFILSRTQGYTRTLSALGYYRAHGVPLDAPPHACAQVRVEDGGLTFGPLPTEPTEPTT